MADNFNYDGDDIELDDNGLPVDVITDDEEYGEEEGQNLLEKGKELYDKGKDAYEKGKKVYEKGKEVYDKIRKTKETADTVKKTADTAKAIGDTAKTVNTALQTANTIGTTATTATTAGAAGGTAVATGGTVAAAGAAGAGVAGTAGTAVAGTAGTAAVANPYVLAAIAIILLIIVVIIIIFVLVFAIAAWWSGKTSEDALKTNSYITSEYFYGIRTAYADDQVLLDSLQLSYKQYAVDIINQLGENPNITIEISLPDNFDNSTEINPVITNISLAIGNIVANNLAGYSGVSFTTIYPNISHFGLTQYQSDVLNDFLDDYLINNNIINVEDGVNLSAELANVTSSDELSYMFTLCEKVMIKDFISSNSGLDGIEKTWFVGSVYMPNTTITLSDMSYTINNQHADRTLSVKLIEVSNETENILVEKSFDENSSDVEIFNPPNNTKVTLQKFASINEDDLSMYSQGLTLFDAIKLIPEDEQYFKQIEIDNNGSKVTVHTWKPADKSSLYLEFTSNEPFMFGEFNLKVETTE